jgi:glycosyltransferase involved in cell wall biosynthesis
MPSARRTNASLRMPSPLGTAVGVMTYNMLFRRVTRSQPLSQAEAGEGPVALPSVSVIVPAFNEERCIAKTLDHLRAAGELLRAHADTPVQVLVVDNASTDRTAGIARDCGVSVIDESEHNIAKVRNAGARAAEHDVLVFVDADTLVPSQSLLRIAQVMATSACLGGAVDNTYDARRLIIRAYLKFWRMVGILGGMAQGACHFCQREAFAELGGYDETMYMGEDVDFFWRLRAAARKRGLRTCFIRDLQVMTSARRFDTWPLWRTLVFTNPIVALALRRRRSPWAGWYEKPPR